MPLFFFFLTLLFAPLLQAMPKIEEVPLTHAVRAVMVEDHYLPIVAVRLSFKHAGYAYDPEAKQGLAQMAAAMMDEGAGAYSANAFRRLMEAHGIRVDVNVEADYLTIAFESTRDSLAMALKLVTQSITHPTLETEALERVRAQMLTAQAHQEEDPGVIAQRALLKAVWGDHPYTRDPLGTREAVQGITKAEIQQFLSEQLTQDALLISVAGDVTKKEWMQLSEPWLATLPLTQVHRAELAAPRWQERSNTPILVTQDIPQSVIRTAFPAPLRNAPDFYAAFVLNHLLGGGVNSRLMQTIREKKGLAYEAGTELQLFANASLITAGADTKSASVKEVMALLRDELQKIKRTSVSAEELRASTDYLTGAFPLKMMQNSQLAALAHAVLLYNQPLDWLEQRNDWVRSVSSDAIRTFTDTLPEASHMPMVVVGRK